MGAIVSLLLALALLGGGGATYASADSLPGELLYPVKLATEQFRLMATQDQASRAQLHLSLADRRLQEATEVKGDPDRLVQSLIGYADQMDQALAILGPQAEVNPALALALRERLTFQYQLLSQMPGGETDQLQERLRAAMEMTNQFQERLGQPKDMQPQEQEQLQHELQQPERIREQERLLLHEGISNTQTISEPVRLQKQQRLQVRSEISSTETVTEPLQLQQQEQEQYRTQDQEQSQERDRAQDQENFQQQDQSKQRSQDQSPTEEPEPNQEQDQKPDKVGDSHGGKR